MRASTPGTSRGSALASVSRPRFFCSNRAADIGSMRLMPSMTVGGRMTMWKLPQPALASLLTTRRKRGMIQSSWNAWAASKVR